MAALTAIGNLSTTDPDAGDTFTYSLVSGYGDNAAFSISGGNQLTINSSPDYETKTTYDIKVRTTDQGGLFFEKVFAIGINNLDEVAPTITSSNTATAINENSGANQVVYTVTSTDTADIATGATIYSLKNVDDFAAFTIDANSGQVTLTGNPDYETKSSYNFTVIAKDAANNQSEKAVTLGINDINENPSVFGFSANSYSVNEDGTTSTPITINRTVNTTGTASVTVNLSGGTATATTDYNSSPIIVNFADGQTSQTIVVPIVLDSITESVETVNLSLSNPTGGAFGATVGGLTTSVLSIIDLFNRSTSTQNETITAPIGASVVNVTTGSGSDTINLTNRTGNIVASAGLGADSIFGGSGNDVLDGGDGDDTIFGNAGADRLFGGAGADTLYGGLGNNRLTGGLGNDIFVLETASGTDLILDFQSGDRFGLTGGLTFGSLSFTANGANTNIVNSGNILAIVTGIAPSVINLSSNFF